MWSSFESASSIFNFKFPNRVLFLSQANQVPSPTAISNNNILKRGQRVYSSVKKAVPILVRVFIKSARLSRNNFYLLDTSNRRPSRMSFFCRVPTYSSSETFLPSFNFSFQTPIHISKVFRLPFFLEASGKSVPEFKCRWRAIDFPPFHLVMFYFMGNVCTGGNKLMSLSNNDFQFGFSALK